MNNDKYIGIFDSGVGGLTVVKALLEKMPNENIVYFADSKHMPYGDKTTEQIREYVLDDVKFLNNYDLKTVLIACNTADAIASNSVKANINIPVYGVIDAAARTAIKVTTNNKIGVIATAATISTNEYTKKINEYNSEVEVYNQACPFLAPLIEDGNFDIGNEEIRNIIEDYLVPLLEKQIDTLILGCTHYDLLLEIIHDMYPELKLVSSSRCVIDDIIKEVESNSNSKPEQLYFVSSNKDKFKQIASKIIPNIEVKEK